MRVVNHYEAIPFRSKLLRSRLGDAWCDFFRNLGEIHSDADRAVFVTHFSGVLSLRPGSSHHKEGGLNYWEPPFTVLLSISDIDDYLEELNELMNAGASARAIKEKEREYITWCNDSLLEAFQLVKVQKAFKSNYSGTLRIYQMAYDDPFEEGETKLLLKAKA